MPQVLKITFKACVSGRYKIVVPSTYDAYTVKCNLSLANPCSRFAIISIEANCVKHSEEFPLITLQEEKLYSCVPVLSSKFQSVSLKLMYQLFLHSH